MTIVDILGYLAAATVAVSMMLKDAARLRAINGVGALMFVAYGVLIHSFPVVILNGFIVVADAYYLRKALMAPPHTTGAVEAHEHV